MKPLEVGSNGRGRFGGFEVGGPRFWDMMFSGVLIGLGMLVFAGCGQVVRFELGGRGEDGEGEAEMAGMGIGMV